MQQPQRTSPALFLSFCLLLAAAHSAVGFERRGKSRTKGTPVESVISLLNKLSAEIQEEGKTEAAAYDKFACFCKQQAGEVSYAIDKSKKQIEILEADIELLAGEIEDLATEEQESKKEVEKTEETMKEDQEARDKEFEKFEMSRKDLEGAVAAITKAMEYLEASKERLSNAKLSMLRNTVGKLVMPRVRAGSLKATKHQVRALHALMGEGSSSSGPAAFLQLEQPKANKYGSNHIIDLLRELRREFKKNLAEKVADEQQSNQDFSLKQQAAGNSVESHKKSIAMSQEIQGAKSDSKSGKEQLLAETKQTLEDDLEYQEEMTENCENKATAWDERSTTRSKELTAISEALGILKGTVSEKYGANKKLVELITPAKPENGGEVEDADEDEDEDEDADEEDVSFLQRRGVRKHAVARRRAVAYLAREARLLKSQALGSLLLHVKADHFVKVRGLINDLIARLEAQAEEEADTKSFCDETMGEAIEKRDEAQQGIEKANADITKFTAEEAALREDIAKLGEQIAGLHKALKEAQDLRDEEKRNNEQTVADAKEGLEAVKNAIEVLKNFYENAFFVQRGSRSVSKKQRPEAPATFEDDYSGKQEASKGIIGLLEVIQSDFERTVQTTEDNEKEAEKEHEKYKTETEKDIDDKVEEKKTKSDDRDTAEGNIGDSKDTKVDKETNKKDALAILEKNRALCVDRGLSWKERTERREHEIEALKQALHILETAFD